MCVLHFDTLVFCGFKPEILVLGILVIIRKVVLGNVLFGCDSFLPQYSTQSTPSSCLGQALWANPKNKTNNCFRKWKQKEKPYLVFTPADMVWFAVVVPLWPWSHRLICGAVIGLAERRWTAHCTLNLTGTQKFSFPSENLPSFYQAWKTQAKLRAVASWALPDPAQTSKCRLSPLACCVTWWEPLHCTGGPAKRWQGHPWKQSPHELLSLCPPERSGASASASNREPGLPGPSASGGWENNSTWSVLSCHSWIHIIHLKTLNL